MKTKHTPGPWTIDDRMAKNKRKSVLWYIIANADHRNIAEVKGRHCGILNTTAEANAKVMAAGLEMLEALEAIRDLIDRNIIVRDISKDSDFEYFAKQGIEIIKVIELMNKAIKKATE